MSNLMKHAMVTGINAALVDRQKIAWPSEKIAFEACAYVANKLSGPEVLTGPLDKMSCELIIGMLKSAADEVAKQGIRPTAEDLNLSKIAAEMDPMQRAAEISEACMAKAASDASLADKGENSPEASAQTDQIGKLDQQNRPGNKFNLGYGKTNFPSGGVVGKQQFVNGSSQNNSLTALDKQADDGRLQQLLAMLQSIPSKARMMGADFVDNTQQQARELMKHTQALRQQPDGIRVQDLPSIGRLAAPLAGKAGLGLGTVAAGGYGLSRALGGGDEDKTAAERSEAAHRGALFVQAMANTIPGMVVNDAVKVAAAGLGASGDRGLQVMGAVMDSIKTASDAEAAIDQILNHQGEVGELASPELVAALQELLEQQGDPDDQDGQVPPGPMDPNMMADKQAMLALPAKAGHRGVVDFLKDHKKAIGAGAATAASIAGAAAAINAARKKNEDKDKDKTAADILAQLKAAADGSLTDTQPNTPSAAAKVDQIAKLDLENRGESEHNVGQGKTKMPSPGQGYATQKAPKAEEPTVSNSLSSETKAAEDAAYYEAFKKVAMDYSGHLPATMTREEKVAALQQVMGLAPSAREQFILSLHAR